MSALLPRHQALLDASAITPEVAEARGYRSIEKLRELRALGFGATQARVPALLLPVWNAAGEVGVYQARPDEPRVSAKGKPIKYETPHESTMLIDVPLPAREGVRDPRRPLFVTEGIRKADSAVSLGLCCIALLGVWNWRGTNEHGGKTALPDWELVALNGRRVYLAFDSDAFEKREVYGALDRLKRFLESRGAEVSVITLPPGEGGAKVGLDDYLAEGHSVGDLLLHASDRLPDPPLPPEGEKP